MAALFNPRYERCSVDVTHLPPTCISIRLGITEVNVVLHYR